MSGHVFAGQDLLPAVRKPANQGWELMHVKCANERFGSMLLRGSVSNGENRQWVSSIDIQHYVLVPFDNSLHRVIASLTNRSSSLK
jgi:hypothetical protein